MKIPSNPINPTVYSFRDIFETNHEKYKPILFEFFSVIDEAIRQGININHTPNTNRLTICPNQLIDITKFLNRKTIDIDDLKHAVSSVTYPRFQRMLPSIKTALWNNQVISVWTFSLLDHQLTPPLSCDDSPDVEANPQLATEKLLSLRSYIKVWRESITPIEASKHIEYTAEDLSAQLQHIQNQLTEAIKLIE